MAQRRALPQMIRCQVLEEASYRCAYCGSVASEVDHIVPVTEGGSNDRSNLNASCRACNGEKSSLTVEQWKTYRLEMGMAWPPPSSFPSEEIAAMFVEFCKRKGFDFEQEKELLECFRLNNVAIRYRTPETVRDAYLDAARKAIAQMSDDF